MRIEESEWSFYGGRNGYAAAGEYVEITFPPRNIRPMLRSKCIKKENMIKIPSGGIWRMENGRKKLSYL